MCMAILGLPDLNRNFAADFRILFIGAFVFWIFPLAYLQRRLWSSRLSWIAVSLLLLASTYCMSVINNIAGNGLALHLGILKSIQWSQLCSGLDGCWLAFISYCAIHAVLIYYFALVREKERSATALAMARDAQLRALRYQLHPHFLFNTLNAISSLVVNERNREANRMITELGDFLRATLESEDCHEHPLADELALTGSYLNIEKARLGSRLSIAIHVGPDVLQAYVPYLMLQPLMENAIRHGIAPLSAGGQVELHIERITGELRIQLKNEVPPDGSSSAVSHGLGLRNVSERLENLYQGRYRFAAGNAGPGQFLVEIVIPYRVASDSGQQAQPWSHAA